MAAAGDEPRNALVIGPEQARLASPFSMIPSRRGSAPMEIRLDRNGRCLCVIMPTRV
jgi:hypothetical protein